MKLALTPSLLSAVLLAGPAAAQSSAGPVKPPHGIFAQLLVDRFVRDHPELTALELAVTTAGGCRTVAATAPEDVGENCDADELGPIRTGKPDVEVPSKADPVYDITQALHDATHHLIGAAGMDRRPQTGPTRAAVVKRARELLRALEAQIPSKARLLETAIP